MENRKIYLLVKPYILWLAVCFLFAFLIMGMNLMLPMVNKMVIDDAILNKNLSLFWQLILAYGIITLLSLILSSFNRYFITKLSEVILIDLRKNLFNAFYSMKYLVADRISSGEVLNRILVEAVEIVPFITSIMLNIVIQVLSLIVTIAVIMYLNLAIGIATLVMLPLVYFMLKYVNPKLRNFNKKVMECNTDISTSLQESIASHKSVRYFSVFKFVNDRFVNNMGKYFEVKMKFVKFNIAYNNFLSLINIIPRVVILGYGGFLIIQGKMTMGTLIALTTYVGRLFSPIMQLLNNNSEIQKARVSLKRYNQFIDLQTEKKSIIEEPIKDIAFKDVSFGYVDQEPLIIEDLNVDFQLGDRIKIIGNNGAGKSTIVDILIGLLEPIKGDIRINGTNRSGNGVYPISDQIGIVPQKAYMFDGSVFENIALSRDIDSESIMKLVNEIGFTDLFEGGGVSLETELKNNGSNVSGGQAQKISILRCLINNPEIIVLDEVGTYLDAATKEKLIGYLNQMDNKLVIYITHSDDFELEYNKTIDLNSKKNRVHLERMTERIQ